MSLTHKKRTAILTAMFRAAKIAAVLLVCLGLSGGHWIALQTVAWTRMLVAYSAEQSLAEALADTFGGERPCEMCVTIQKEKSAEQKKEAATHSIKQIEGVLAADAVLVIPERRDGFAVATLANWRALSFSPPTPPPKV
jgi:glycine cleavage system pyridoxal-binding protein P